MMALTTTGAIRRFASACAAYFLTTGPTPLTIVSAIGSERVLDF